MKNLFQKIKLFFLDLRFYIIVLSVLSIFSFVQYSKYYDIKKELVSEIESQKFEIESLNGELNMLDFKYNRLEYITNMLKEEHPKIYEELIHKTE